MKIKRILTAVLILLVCSLTLSSFVSANSPEFPDYFTVYIYDPPTGAAYVDLLIELPVSDSHYSPLEAQNIPSSFSENAEILTYCDSDGYRSYTFHYQGAKAQIKLKRDGVPHTYFFVDDLMTYDATAYQHARDICSRGSVKLAILDQEGNLLHVSEKLGLNNGNMFLTNTNNYYYTLADGKWVVDTFQYGISMIFEWLCKAVMIFLNMLLELLVASIFGLYEYRRCIIWTNIASQLLMRIAYRLLRGLIPTYFVLTLILEVFVYIGEYLVYRRSFTDVSRRKCLAYTLTANTLTLVFGVALQIFLFSHL